LVAALSVAFLASLSTALLLVLSARWHRRFTADAPGSGPQKLHERVTPRVGGIAIMVGFALAVVVARVQSQAEFGTHAPPWLTGWFVLALFIPFAAGLIEDVTKAFGARARLLATFAGAAIAFFFCDAALTRFAIPDLDKVLAASWLLQLILTLFCVGAIANAYNLADGLNGLLAGLTITATLAMAWIARQYNDQFIAVAAGSLAAATAAFALFNFPRARLFAGDGGAYLVGSAISLLAILLCRRHLDVSPWFVFVLVIYPFIDTTAAIVRRKLAGQPIMAPDAGHLHSLLAARLQPRLGRAARNAASVLIVTASGVIAVGALPLHRNTPALVALALAAAVAYIVLYRRLLPAVTEAATTARVDAASEPEITVAKGD